MSSTSSSQAPMISVIMPSYNTADLISASLDSALQQSFRSVEIIVVNDGSPDTVELEKALAPYRDKIIYIKQENKRAAGARNTAIRRANGEFLAFLDSDDIWHSNHLEKQMSLFTEDPTLDLVYCNCVISGTSTRNRDFMSLCPSRGPATFQAIVVERCQIPISTVVARKSALVRAGLFDEGLQRCDDYDMWLRAAFHGAKIGYSRTVQARLYPGRPGSLGASNVKMVEAYWQILEKAKKNFPLTGGDREIVEQRAAQIRARYLVEEGKLSLRTGEFDKARALLSEGNAHLRRPRLSLLLLGLKIAPEATNRLVSLARRMLGGETSA
jgi:glycosyltransferase involved in cell wall biosynthesis